MQWPCTSGMVFFEKWTPSGLNRKRVVCLQLHWWPWLRTVSCCLCCAHDPVLSAGSPAGSIRTHHVLCNLFCPVVWILVVCEGWMAGAFLNTQGSWECQIIWLNLFGLKWGGGGGGDEHKADFLCVVYGKLIRKLIRNVNTCNYSKETGLAIVTHCGPSSNPGGSKERFPSLLFLLNSYPFLETNFV